MNFKFTRADGRVSAGRAAEMLRVCKSSVVHFCRLGLLTPERDARGFRWFQPDQVRQLRRLRARVAQRRCALCGQAIPQRGKCRRTFCLRFVMRAKQKKRVENYVAAHGLAAWQAVRRRYDKASKDNAARAASAVSPLVALESLSGAQVGGGAYYGGSQA